MLIDRTTGTETPAGIDPAKVLIVINSNAATVSLSTAGADAYCALRGIPTANRLAYDMGASRAMTDANILTLRAAIQAAVIANGYEAVLFSLATPLYSDKPDVDGDGASLPEYATRFSFTYIPTFGQTRCDESLVPASATRISSRAAQRYIACPKSRTAVETMQPPHGRIGFPIFTGADSLVRESVSLMQARVADAIAAEGNGAWNNAQWIVSIHERVQDVAYHCAEALAVLREAGLNPAFWYNTLSAGLRDSGGNLIPPAQSAPSGTPWDTHTHVINGVASPISFMGYTGAALANTAGQTNSFIPLPGSIVFEWTSYGYVVGHELVLKGACSYMSAMLEPYSSNLIRQQSFVMGLLNGLSLCELNNTNANAKAVAIGDPLYQPYKNLRRTTWVM